MIAYHTTRTPHLIRFGRGGGISEMLDGLNVLLYVRMPGDAFAGDWTAGAYLVAGAKFEHALTTLVESQRVETTMIVSWTHILDRCY